MPDLIRDHVWRSPPSTTSGPYGATRGRGPALQRPCEYMSCGRPRSEHRWAASRKRKPAKAGAR